MNESFTNKLLNWTRRHKIIATVGGVVIFILLIAVIMSFSWTSQQLGTGFSPAGVANDMAYQRSAGEAVSPTAEDGASADADIPGVEITEGRLTVDSESAVDDEETVRSVTESYGGYIEEGNQSESPTRLQIRLTTRVPSADFADYLQELRDQLEVDDYNIRNYRIEIEEQTTELDIIRGTHTMYEEMKEELQAMPVDAERINLTMDITERQLDLKERENRLAQRVDRVTRRGDMATLHVTLKERLSAEVWPEDLGNDFRDQLREAIDEVVQVAIAIVTTSLVVFMTAIQWAVYLLITLLVLWFVFRLLRRLYRRWYE